MRKNGVTKCLSPPTFNHSRRPTYKADKKRDDVERPGQPPSQPLPSPLLFCVFFSALFYVVSVITPPTLHSSSVPQSSSFIFTLVFKIYTQSLLRLPILRPRTYSQDAHEAFTLHPSISNFHLLSLHSRCIVLPSLSTLHSSPSSSFCPLSSFSTLSVCTV